MKPLVGHLWFVSVVVLRFLLLHKKKKKYLQILSVSATTLCAYLKVQTHFMVPYLSPFHLPLLFVI